MSAQAKVEEVRMLLAEAGYPDVILTWSDAVGVVIGDGCPDAVAWRAWVLSDPTGMECWPCWSSSGPEGDTGEPEEPCGHDPLTSPWPQVAR